MYQETETQKITGLPSLKPLETIMEFPLLPPTEKTVTQNYAYNMGGGGGEIAFSKEDTCSFCFKINTLKGWRDR